MKKLDISQIKQVPLKESQYFKEEVKKVQIVLHHTAGNSSAPSTIKMWDTDDRGRIATCITISGQGLSKDTFDGEICQAFSSKNWAYHLGIKPDVFRSKGVAYQKLDRIAIGIEICNWGPLTLKDGKYYNYVNREVPLSQVCILDTPYKGFKVYHAYTDAQIESVRQLLVYWNETHGIPLAYNEKDMWDVSTNALKAVPGVYTHNSYRRDKSDISPQPKMIAMLKSLTL
jgi:N-acetyl-anhydromuramyl-L-alanine amidase AmpD